MFTLDKGAIPARSVHLYCNGRPAYYYIIKTKQLTLVLACNTNYHHNFSVKDGLRTYYDGIPCMIQVGEHQFAEKRVIKLWISMMLLSWSVVVL